MPLDKQRTVTEYLHARRMRSRLLWSAAPLVSSDIVHLLAMVMGKGGADEPGKVDGDKVADLLGSVFGQQGDDPEGA